MVSALNNRLGFAFRMSRIRNNIFIPKYYDPSIGHNLNSLQRTHELVSIDNLITAGHLSVDTGDEIGKMSYGTGHIPFVRTSDISNWEIKYDPKQGVSEEIYTRYAKKQDVRSEDIFFVRDGTYLIGQSCIITDQDLPLLYQSHILKFRIRNTSPLSSWLFFASLNSPIVKKQIRSRQFTADIIDTIGNRYRELLLPIPKDNAVAARVIADVQEAIYERVKLRELIRKIPFWAQGVISNLSDDMPTELLYTDELQGNSGFKVSSANIRTDIFVPKYYDPQLEADLSKLAKTHELIPLSKLVRDGILSWNTGIEIGKMAYGTGRIPFIRTSDISNWELKGDPKQNVSEEIYEANKQDVKAGDIFVVRDGTYLVGTSCILTEHDTKILYCGGIYKLRIERENELDPYLLLALLNSPIVRRQMKSKQFTRDIIDTLGKRLFEIVIPIPKDKKIRHQIASETREVIETRARLRNRTKEIALEVEGIERPKEEDLEVLEQL